LRDGAHPNETFRSPRRIIVVECRCQDIAEIRGDGAFEYAEQHLERVVQENGAWHYRCPTTGQEWVLDTTKEWDTGHGGRGRLRRSLSPNPPSRPERIGRAVTPRERLRDGGGKASAGRRRVAAMADPHRHFDYPTWYFHTVLHAPDRDRPATVEAPLDFRPGAEVRWDGRGYIVERTVFVIDKDSPEPEGLHVFLAPQ
jgi:hypothetical protein